METFLRDLASAQQGQGLETAVMVHQNAPGLPTRKDDQEGVPVLRCRQLGQLAYAPLAPTFGLHLGRLARTMQPHVVHVHMPNVSGFWALRLPGDHRLVIHWHSDVTPAPGERLLASAYRAYRIFERRLLARADLILATSDAYLASSRPLQPMAHKCRIVPLGIDTRRMAAPSQNHLDATRKEYGPAPLIVSAGRFTAYKGFETLIRAAEALPEVQVVIAGDGPLHTRLRELTDRLGLTERVHLPGYLADRQLHALIAACDVFCLPSIERTEAFGVVLLEAMHYARPLVTTNITGSGVTEVNKAGTTGLSAAVGDPADLARQLGQLVSDQALARAMGKAARQRLENRYSLESVASCIQKLYAQTAS